MRIRSWDRTYASLGGRPTPASAAHLGPTPPRQAGKASFPISRLACRPFGFELSAQISDRRPRDHHAFTADLRPIRRAIIWRAALAASRSLHAKAANASNSVAGAKRCKGVIQTNNVEVDERGFIYIVERAHTAMHILELTAPVR